MKYSEVIDTSKKEEFIRAWQEQYGNMSHPRIYHEQKKYKDFADRLNAHPELKTLFYEAWEEAKTVESDPATGLALLFPGKD